MNMYRNMQANVNAVTM